MTSDGSETKYGTTWSRDELILALYAYCQIPFARTKANNPEVIRLASLLGRTASSVARKLGNFGAFDPRLAEHGITGLTHYSKRDREIWDEFRHDWEGLVSESGHLLGTFRAQRTTLATEDAPVISLPGGPTEKRRLVMTRLRQSFFRRAVLSSYQSACCVCDIDVQCLLVASHIIPWSVSRDSRTDPTNGLCMCVLHDRAFDTGLIAVQPDFTVVVSRNAITSRLPIVQTALFGFDGRQIRLPTRFVPEGRFLQWHVENVLKP